MSSSDNEVDQTWNAFSESGSINHWESDQNLLRYINGMSGRWDISFKKLWLKNAHDKVSVGHFNASVYFFVLRLAHYLKELACEGRRDKSLRVLSSCHFITFMLKHPSEFGGQSGAPFCWSVRLCRNTQPQKNVNNVEARGRLMGSLQCQTIPGSVCGWLSICFFVFFFKLLKMCQYCFKSAAQLLYNRIHKLLRRWAWAVLLTCPFWKGEKFKRRKISYGLVPPQVMAHLCRRQRTHIFHPILAKWFNSHHYCQHALIVQHCTSEPNE